MGYGHSKPIIDDIWKTFNVNKIIEYELCREISVSGPNIFKLIYDKESVVLMISQDSSYLLRITPSGPEIKMYKNFIDTVLGHSIQDNVTIKVTAGIGDQVLIDKFLNEHC